MEERLLIQKARKGDHEAFGSLYDVYLPAIYRFILLKVSNRADAEDLTHQVFLSAWQKMPQYADRGFPFSSWLYRIARNAVIDFYRTHRSHFPIEAVPEDIFADFPDPADAVHAKLQIQLVRAGLHTLEEEQQSVVVMRFVNDLSTKEIAHALGKSEGAVRVIQHRALKQLKSFFNDDHELQHTSSV